MQKKKSSFSSVYTSKYLNAFYKNKGLISKKKKTHSLNIVYIFYEENINYTRLT